MKLNAYLAVARNSMQYINLKNVPIGNCHFYTKNFMTAQISSPFFLMFAIFAQSYPH